MFSENGGFIHHPSLATNFSGLAVFHQLHCLVSSLIHTRCIIVNALIQKALYNLYYNSQEHGLGHSQTRALAHTDHSVHARHCFDYLRQSLLCLADTNLEPYNYTLDGVTGWGQKTCRSVDSVFAFANSWGGSKYANKRSDK